MTIPSTARAWLIGVAIVSAIIFAFVFSWNHAHGRISELERSVEQEKLAKEGEITAHLQTKAQLAVVAAKEMASDQALAVAVAKLKLVQPDVQLQSARTLSTGVVVVDAEPEEEPEKEASPRMTLVCGPGCSPDGDSTLPQTSGMGRHVQPNPGDALPSVAPLAPSVNPSPFPESTCVLRNGDPASISVNELTFKTLAGNYIPVGTATAWREGPGPRTKLFSHAFEASLSDANGLAAPTLPRWGFGMQGVLFPAGAAVGPGVAFPPARFTIFGHAIEIDANANFLIGTLGAGLGAGAYARF